MRRRKREVSEAEARAENERATRVVTASAWEAKPNEWRAGEFEVRVFEPRDETDRFRDRRVVVRGRVSGRIVEARGPIVFWSILRCLIRLHYLNADANPGQPLAPMRRLAPTPDSSAHE